LAHLGDLEMKKDNADKALALLQKAIERKNDIRLPT